MRGNLHGDPRMYLVCPAGNLPALKAAVDGGADAVYLGFRDQTNARAFPGLNFTESDLDALPPGIRIRLVIGIYSEPDEIAITDKREMKERMLRFARTLLERGHYVEFATHDEPFVRRFVDEVVPATGVGLDRFEVQMLYGVPRDRLLGELRGRSVRCRLYVPFALGWPMAIAYLRRRLDEYPSMVFLVARNWLFRG